MKKIRVQSILAAVAGLFLATSCSSSFLDAEPTDTVSPDQVTVAGSAERLFDEAWYNLFEYGAAYVNVGYRAFQYQDGMMASDAVSHPECGFDSSYQFNDVTIPSNGRASFAWYLIYKTIDNCNTVTSVRGDSEELRQAQGQALVLRASCYLYLVQHYQFTYLKDKDAPCVPIYTGPTTSSTKPKGKSTVAQVFQQVFDDLNLTQDYLTDYVRRGGGQKFKPNTDVVSGLLTRTYLLTGQWGEAAKAVEAVHKGYSSVTIAAGYGGFNSIFNKEWIWGPPQALSQSDAGYNFHYLDATYVETYSSFIANPHLMNTFAKDGIRLPLFQWMREGYLSCEKFHVRSDDTADLVLMRSAEMCLIGTEAKARDGVALDQTVTPLSTLRTARDAGNYDVAGKTKEQVIDEILMERQRELWGEGFGITDILHNQKAVGRMALSEDMQKTEMGRWQEGDSFVKRDPLGHWFLNFPDSKTFSANDSYYLYAIPGKEINTNPNL